MLLQSDICISNVFKECWMQIWLENIQEDVLSKKNKVVFLPLRSWYPCVCGSLPLSMCLWIPIFGFPNRSNIWEDSAEKTGKCKLTTALCSLHMSSGTLNYTFDGLLFSFNLLKAVTTCTGFVIIFEYREGLRFRMSLFLKSWYRYQPIS